MLSIIFSQLLPTLLHPITESKGYFFLHVNPQPAVCIIPELTTQVLDARRQYACTPYRYFNRRPPQGQWHVTRYSSKICKLEDLYTLVRDHLPKSTTSTTLKRSRTALEITRTFERVSKIRRQRWPRVHFVHNRLGHIADAASQTEELITKARRFLS